MYCPLCPHLGKFRTKWDIKRVPRLIIHLVANDLLKILNSTENDSTGAFTRWAFNALAFIGLTVPIPNRFVIMTLD